MRQALELALEALELHGQQYPHMVKGYCLDAITAIKEALAQPEQEPMALPCCAYTDASAIKWNPYNQVVQCHNCGQIYTTPPQRTWVGLTRAERFEIEKAMSKYYDYQHECKTVCLPEFAAAIEAKLKEKNT